MRERAEKISGTLDIVSGPGSGTEIQLKVPRLESLSRNLG